MNPTIEDGVTHLLSFKEPLVRAAIHEAKFQGSQKAWRMLGSVLEAYLKQLPDGITVVPIPLSLPRRIKRGYNQVAMVARRGTRSVSQVTLDQRLIYRRRHTAAQTSMKKREDRLRNMTDAFGVRHSSSISGKNIILLDDVATTGATLKAAKLALEPHHPSSITLLALAH